MESVSDPRKGRKAGPGSAALDVHERPPVYAAFFRQVAKRKPGLLATARDLEAQKGKRPAQGVSGKGITEKGHSRSYLMPYS